MENQTNQKTLKMVSIVPLKSYIENLSVSESESVAIQNLCKEYTEKLNNGFSEEQLCEQFVSDLSKIANSENSKSILNDVNEAVKANETNLKLANLVHGLSKGSCMFVAPMIESVIVNYITNKNNTTRNEVRSNISLFESDSLIKSILEALQYEQYEENSGKSLVNATLKEEFKTAAPKTYTQEEVDKILSNRIDEMTMASAEANKPKKSFARRIMLNETIKSILKNTNNEKLRVFCESYINALNSGKSEELLYESFISGISNWNYLSAVDTELSALKSRVENYKDEIDLKKILETMLQTGSYYIVPLIEDVVLDYVDNKNMNTRGILLQRLNAFEYDPFVRDMECLITRDLSLNNTVYLGESVEYLNNQVKTELVFSPVKYIKENECIFNVKGSYYARKGNSIAKLTKNEVDSLSESFKNLCNIVNLPNVKFSNELNSATVYDGSNIAIITESEITINNNEVTTDELKSLKESAIAMRSDDAKFYSIVDTINENYDDIAYINFVKRIESKDNSGKSCDVFKLKESIFVNTTDGRLGRSTFYRNVNPIQCRKYINEHMEINCAPLFEDELPEQDKIVSEIAEKKQEYQKYIDSLEEKKATLLQMKDEGADTEDIDKAIQMIDQELDDTKKDFLAYQKDSDKYLNGNGDEEDSLNAEIPEINDDDEQPEEKKETGEKDDKDLDLDPEKETPAEMEEPIEDKPQIDAEEESPVEDDEYAEVAEYDPDFDVPTKIADEGHTIGYGKFQIVKVSYRKNVKNGVTDGKGEVIVIIPSVDANGDIHDDMRKISFYLDTDKTPIINNEYMPLDMYNAIVDAINEDPVTSTINVVAQDEPVDNTDEVPIPGEEIADTIETVEPEEQSVEDTTTDTIEDIPAEETETKTEVEEEPEKEVETPEIQETPAEIQAADAEKSIYPISVGLYPEEISPIELPDFEKDLDKMKIEHSESESGNGELCIKIGNKAQATALKKYFHTWMDYTDGEFINFFPELKNCFENKPTNIPVMPANESVQIVGVKTDVNESKKEKFRVLLPSTDSLCKVFNTVCESEEDMFEVIPQTKEEEKKIYEALYTYARKNNGNVEQDVIDFLEKYGEEYGRICESEYSYKLTVPYNSFLEQKLKSKGFETKHLEESLKTEITKDSYKKAKKLLEGFYGDAAPVEVREFCSFVNENVTITVKDDTTGKTVTINTDELNNKENNDSEKENTPDFDSQFKGVTFNPEESLAFSDDEESADEEEDKKNEAESSEETIDDAIEDTEKEASDKEEENEGEEKSEEETEETKETEEKTEDEKPKKKFKFKSKKSKSNESVVENGVNTLNEQTVSLPIAEPTVLDFIITKDGKKGQIISQQADGMFIVNVSGHTLIYPKNEVKLANIRFDTLEPPVKFDTETLKGIYESMVYCGLFVNETRVTPSDCMVKLSEYIQAKENDEINIIIEGESTKAIKKYIRITESLEDVFLRNEPEDIVYHQKDALNNIAENLPELVVNEFNVWASSDDIVDFTNHINKAYDLNSAPSDNLLQFIEDNGLQKDTIANEIVQYLSADRANEFAEDLTKNYELNLDFEDDENSTLED